MAKTTTKAAPAAGFTKEGYDVPAGEETYAHVLIDKPVFHSQTGKRESVPYVQKFDAHGGERSPWGLFCQSGPSLGYVVEDVLHLPAGAREYPK